MTKSGGGMPIEIERKYLILRPDAEILQSLPECSCTRIVQTYLADDGEGFCKRVRMREDAEHVCEYTFTRKKTVGFGERIELEDTISAERYAALIQNADPERFPVEKHRYCFRYREQLFELDVYAFEQKLATLEIELPSMDTPVQLPAFLTILADVTETPGYSNFALSKALKFPAL